MNGYVTGDVQLVTYDQNFPGGATAVDNDVPAGSKTYKVLGEDGDKISGLKIRSGYMP